MQDHGIKIGSLEPLHAFFYGASYAFGRKYNRSSSFSGVRARWTPLDIERRSLLVEKLRQITDATNISIAIVALRYILAQSAVSTVIPGSKNVQQWELNASASQEDLDPVLVQQLRDFWTQEIAQNPIPW